MAKSWLKEQKLRLDKEKQRIREEQQKIINEGQARQKEANDLMNKLINDLGIKGKKSKFGKITTRMENNYCYILGGEKKLVELWVYYKEGMDEYRTGPNGEYYLMQEMRFCENWKKSDGRLRKYDDTLKSFDEDRLAEYLLNFINV